MTEVLLLSCGFSDSHALGRGLNSLMEHLESQVNVILGGQTSSMLQKGAHEPPVVVNVGGHVLLIMPRPLV